MWAESLAFYLIFEGVNSLTGFRLQPLPNPHEEFAKFLRLWEKAGLLNLSVKVGKLVAGVLLLIPSMAPWGLFFWGIILWGIVNLQFFLNRNGILPFILILWAALAAWEIMI